MIVRQFPEGPQYSYVDTFALETSTDAVYFREAFLLLIKRTELFADVNTVYLVGDNGRLAYPTPIYFESSLRRPAFQVLRNFVVPIPALGHNNGHLQVNIVHYLITYNSVF